MKGHLLHCLHCSTVLIHQPYEKRYCDKNCFDARQATLVSKDKAKYHRLWYEKNFGSVKEYYRVRRASESLEKYVFNKLQQRQRAMKKPFLFFSFEELQEWLLNQELICGYCGVPLTHFDKRKETTITLDRLDNSRGYSLDNIRLACIVCNRARGDLLSVEEMKIVGDGIKKVWESRGYFSAQK